MLLPARLTGIVRWRKAACGPRKPGGATGKGAWAAAGRPGMEEGVMARRRKQKTAAA